MFHVFLALASGTPPSPMPTPVPTTGGGGSGGPSLADVANAFVIGGFILTLFAAGFAGWQLRQQSLVQRFNAVLETNRLWWDAPTVRSTQVSAMLSGPTLDLIADIYEHVILDRASVLGRWPAPRPDAVHGVPYLLAALLPIGATAPTSEEEYQTELLDRAVCVGLVLTLLRQVADGADISDLIPTGRTPTSVTASVKTELAALFGALERYVNALNEVVELYEARMIDRHLFLGKRHVAIIQQVFVIEPYLLWRNTVYPGRWGMRLLAMGQAARAYHWASPLHARTEAQPLTLRGDPDAYGRGVNGEPALSEQVGVILTTTAAQQRARPRRLRRVLNTGFAPSNRQAQNELGDQLLATEQRGIEVWMRLARDARAQRRCQATFSGQDAVTMAPVTDMRFDPVPVPEWNLDADDPTAECIAQIDAWISSPALQAVVESFHGQIPEGSLSERLAFLDDFSEQHWDFRRGRERNLVEEPQAEDHVVKVALAAAAALGLGADNPPRRCDYDAILVLGGLIRACLVRPENAARLVKAGVSTREVAALGGFRRLAGDELPIAEKYHLHEEPDEFWAMDAGMRLAFGPLPEPDVYEQVAENANASALVHTYRTADLPMLRVIAAPSTEPEIRRANSKDTYVYWAENLAHLPPNPRVLLITTSIYVPYQGCVAIEALGVEHGVGVETLGISMNSDLFADDPQQFVWFHYIQEIRSAIRGMRSLHTRLLQTNPGSREGVNRPGSGGGSQSMEDESHGSTQEVR